MEIDYRWDLDQEFEVPQTEEFKLDLEFYDEEAMWQAKTGLDRDGLCGAIETVIFMSDRPISIQKLKVAIDAEIPLRVIHECLERLQAEYENKHHGIRLMEVAEGYQFRTKATYSKIVQKMYQVSSFVLSPTALEVLAIIAYRQPISRTQIESIRGVDSSHIVRALMDKRLVKIAGRSEEELGKPSVFATTPEFLEVFNLKDLSELPPEHELKDLALHNNVGAINEIRAITSREDVKSFNYDEIEELDQLSSAIKEISPDTAFTKSLAAEDKLKSTPSEGSRETKTAFDILEEYILRSETAKQNKLASESERPASLETFKAAVAVVEEVSREELEAQSEALLEEFFPESSESSEEVLFEVPQHPAFDEDEEWIEEEGISAKPAILVEAEEVEDAEAKALEDALNKAFANLGVWKDDSSLKDQAEELDLDLKFLQDDLDQEQDKA